MPDQSRHTYDDFNELGHFEVDPSAVQLLSQAFCRRHEVVILGKIEADRTLEVLLGVLDDQDYSLGQLVAQRLQRPVKMVRLNRFEINKVIEQTWPVVEPRRQKSAHQVHVNSVKPGPDAKPAELVDDLLLHALAKGASDIHIEAYPGDVDVRLRVDGVLRQLPTLLSPDNLPAVINRIKVMAKLDITERRAPQDGRFRVDVVEGAKERAVDFRVSILPGLIGEDAVLRILDSGKSLLSIERLGMPEEPAEELRRLVANPEGLVLVSGPTGSGKTTTLYASLLELQCSTRKVVTAEDPVEYFIPKLNQKQTSAQVSMADLTRAFLRQDPDVILVGEIRDRETALAAAQAATTGHLVLSTLHTNDALGAVPRLRGLGLSDDILADAILGCLNQRLIRRVCPNCKETTAPTAEQRQLLGPFLDDMQLVKGAGCDSCFGSGYRGRVGLFEFLLFNETLQDLLSSGMPVAELRKVLKENNHRTLIEDGLDKVRDGTTSLEELLRVVPIRAVLGQLS
jgi:type II secretory ATPase GspE/PulE/Tfp pilus assembly ATPase PilB-like protein